MSQRPAANLSRLVNTVVIDVDPQCEIRGYSLVGREFVLKEPNPRFDECRHSDGVILKETFYVVAVEEFLRVVPEASRSDHPGREVYIPVYVARRSFRPRYLPSRATPRF